MGRASAHRRYRAAGDSGVIVSFDDLLMASASSERASLPVGSLLIQLFLVRV